MLIVGRVLFDIRCVLFIVSCVVFFLSGVWYFLLGVLFCTVVSWPVVFYCQMCFRSISIVLYVLLSRQAKGMKQVWVCVMTWVQGSVFKWNVLTIIVHWFLPPHPQ